MVDKRLLLLTLLFLAANVQSEPTDDSSESDAKAVANQQETKAESSASAGGTETTRMNQGKSDGEDILYVLGSMMQPLFLEGNNENEHTGGYETNISSNTDEAEGSRKTEYIATTPLEPNNSENGNLLVQPSTTYESSIMPVQELTSGGYSNPYPLEGVTVPEQTLRTESTTPQANEMKIRGNEANYQSMPPLNFPTESVSFRQPIYPPENTYRAFSREMPNPFYNIEPESNQGQYTQLGTNNNFRGFPFTLQTAPRAVVPNSEYSFQNPLHVPQRPAFFQSGISSGYPNQDSGMDSSGADFMPLFANLPPVNPQFLYNPHLYGSGIERNFFTNPRSNYMTNFPNSNDGLQVSPRIRNYPRPSIEMPQQNVNRQLQISNPSLEEEKVKLAGEINESPKKEESESIPFGTRFQRQNGDLERGNLQRQDNVYIRYPMAEAGYATEENLPLQNDTDMKVKESKTPIRPPFPFFDDRRSQSVFSGIDPYKAALENVRTVYTNVMDKNNDNKNSTDEPVKFVKESIITDQPRPDVPPQVFRAFSNQPDFTIPNTPFYQIQGVNAERNRFEPLPLFPDNNYQYPPRSPQIEQNTIPTCAQKTNASLCFEDPDYPRAMIMYALNSGPLFIDRMVMPNQRLGGVTFVEQNTTENPESEDNYICKSTIETGLPLRGMTVRGDWKIIVNMGRAIGGGRFEQPYRMETCRGAGEPCSFAEVKTTCVQKYSIQRFLSWNIEKGLHEDSYRLPVACSCQLLETKA